MCQLTLLVTIIDGFATIAPLGINCAHSAVPAWPVDHCKRAWHVSQENYKVEDITFCKVVQKPVSLVLDL